MKCSFREDRYLVVKTGPLLHFFFVAVALFSVSKLKNVIKIEIQNNAVK